MPAARIGALSGVPSGLMYGISNQLLTNPMIKATTKKAPDAAIEARRNLRFVPWTMRPNVHSEPRAPLLRASVSTVLLDDNLNRCSWYRPVEEVKEHRIRYYGCNAPSPAHWQPNLKNDIYGGDPSSSSDGCPTKNDRNFDESR